MDKNSYLPAKPGSSEEEEIIRENLPLVKTVVGRIAMTLPAHIEIEDIYSAGLMGLLNASRNYNPEHGTSFEGYAQIQIRRSIMDELRRRDWNPRSVCQKARKIQEVMGELESRLGRIPNEQEVAKAMYLSTTEYQSLLDEVKPSTFICLDTASESIDNSARNPTLEEKTGDERDRRELTRLIAERLEQLPEMQRKVLSLYYFDGLRLRQIADAYGLTESRICQLHSQAILSIKSYLRKMDMISD